MGHLLHHLPLFLVDVVCRLSFRPVPLNIKVTTKRDCNFGALGNLREAGLSMFSLTKANIGNVGGKGGLVNHGERADPAVAGKHAAHIVG